jgi:hypothetical protein
LQHVTTRVTRDKAVPGSIGAMRGGFPRGRRRLNRMHD